MQQLIGCLNQIKAIAINTQIDAITNDLLRNMNNVHLKMLTTKLSRSLPCFCDN